MAQSDDGATNAVTRELQSQFEEPGTVKETFLDETGDVRARLEAEGIVTDASLESFDDEIDETSFALVEDGIGVTAERDPESGQLAATLVGVASLDDREIELRAQPEGGTPLAIVSTEKSEDLQMVRPNSTDQMVHDEDCVLCPTDGLNCGSPVPKTRAMGNFTEQASCTNGFDCWREPTCDECPDQSKCDDNGLW